ncbi:Thiol-disulfide oxidoreductase resA [Porphyromonas macacae]|uniref:Thiol-disulfide oxidoreductase resA n=1 Tax=Porphyromonas macacae TaxID=28115 RepID=A0A379EC14_9PORP|nr:TlpA disulfide reductase family protein [Porphyromonas macacae]SUB89931.1 Thiol-disulfide oxidoreductase resA [Porphyromonas macacae]
MAKKLLLAAGVILALASCNKQPANTYTISGTLPDSLQAEGKMVYLYKGKEVIDSTAVVNNAFTFTGTVSDSLKYATVLMKKTFSSLVFMEPGKIIVDATEEVVTGTPLNDAYGSYNKEMKGLQKNMREKIEPLTKDSTMDEKIAEKMIDSIYEKYTADAKDLNLKYFDKHTNDIIGTFIFIQLVNGDLTPEQFAELKGKAGEYILADENVKNAIERQENLIATQPGADMRDFNGVNDEGNEVKLSDFVGKGHYVLVDFWASWCGPCRHEIPNLVNIYKEYKSKGLEIVGVAVWDKMEDHLKAVKELNVTWPQILNEKEATQLYGIAGIPQIILFGPDGKIVKRDLRGEDIKKTLDEIIAEKKML